MTDHSIEELEQQVARARGKRNESELAYRAAIDRLNTALIAKADAEFAERGITVGSRVFAESKDWDDVTQRSDVGVFMGHAIRYSRVSPIVRKLTKSGHPHKSQDVRVVAYWEVWHLAPE